MPEIPPKVGRKPVTSSVAGECVSPLDHRESLSIMSLTEGRKIVVVPLQEFTVPMGK